MQFVGTLFLDSFGEAREQLGNKWYQSVLEDFSGDTNLLDLFFHLWNTHVLV
jgi:hypothetical protein